MEGKWLVRFILEDQHSLDIVVPDEQSARKMVAEWASGHLALQGLKRLHGVDDAGRSWAVDLVRIQACLCARIDNPQQAAGQIAAGRYQPGRSGSQN